MLNNELLLLAHVCFCHCCEYRMLAVLRIVRNMFVGQ
uniref:Uncharacterized protein n=1 Tax=Arundo donax TaxID=35708 RepID=A0A0A9F8B4_ARUDO